MTVQSISLTSITGKMASALATSTAIASYCVTAYGTAPAIFVGLDGKNPPNETDCPFILLLPIQKEEGPQIEEFSYSVTVGWAIVDETSTTATKRKDIDGLAGVDGLGQLIYQCLVEAGNYPVSQVSYSIEGAEFWPQFLGRMELEIRVTVARGEILAY